MFDKEIQSATTKRLEEILKSLSGKVGVGATDLAVRIAKELRYRSKHAKDS